METTNQWNTYDAYLDRKLEAAGIPGAQICVMEKDRVVFQKNYGFRDEAGTLPVDDETAFGIASLSKSITCLALALLEQEGKFSFDEPVSRYFPEFRVPGTPREALLIRHLCDHTAGIPPLPVFGWSVKQHTPDDPWEVEEAEQIRQSAPYPIDTAEDIIRYISAGGTYTPLGQPGQFMSYLNEGYAILSSLADIVAGEPLESYCEREIFAKLGMTHTTFDLEKMKASDICTDLFFDYGGEKRCSKNWEGDTAYRGCGFIRSTAADLVRYYLALSQNGCLEGKQVIPAAAVERMIGKAFPETRRPVYCFGLSKRTLGKHVLISHDGGLKGVASIGGFLKDEGFAVAILTNYSGVDRLPLFFGAVNAHLGDPLDKSLVWIKASGEEPECPEMYVGRYASQEEKDACGEIFLDEDGKLACRLDDFTLSLLFAGETDFIAVPKGSGLTTGDILTFRVRDGKAWGATYGSRIYQRVE